MSLPVDRITNIVGKSWGVTVEQHGDPYAFTHRLHRGDEGVVGFMIVDSTNDPSKNVRVPHIPVAASWHRLRVPCTYVVSCSDGLFVANLAEALPKLTQFRSDMRVTCTINRI